MEKLKIYIATGAHHRRKHHTNLKNYAAFIITTIFVVITACVKSAHLNVNTLSAAGTPVILQSVVESMPSTAEGREERTESSLSLSLTELQQMRLRLVALQDGSPQQQQRISLLPSPVVDSAGTPTRNALNTAAIDGMSILLMPPTHNSFEKEENGKHFPKTQQQHNVHSAKHLHHHEQHHQNLQIGRTEYQHLQQQQIEPSSQYNYHHQDHQHRNSHRHQQHRQHLRQIPFRQQYKVDQQQPHAQESLENNGFAEGVATDHLQQLPPHREKPSEISIITEHFPSENIPSNQDALLNGHSHRSKYTIEDLLHNKFEKKLSSDVYMDPCKAGKCHQKCNIPFISCGYEMHIYDRDDNDANYNLILNTKYALPKNQ